MTPGLAFCADGSKISLVMSICLAKLKPVVAALLVAFLAMGAPALAQEDDETALLELLKVVPAQEAAIIERELVTLWSRSGSKAMDLLLCRGRQALQQGDVDSAIAHLTALTDHAPDFAEGWNTRAVAYYQAGLYGPSIADIQRTLALNPNHFGAMAGLAIMLEEMGDFENALRVQRQVRALHPTRNAVTEAIARLERLAGTTDL